jgi:hypothetical protein
MTWTAYQVTFRLLSPLHIGWRKLGNLQQTRPYITGRNLWGAFTARLTRELGGKDYEEVGKLVDQQLAFTYFYPSTQPDSVLLWPWPDQWDEFAWTFLGSYASTALENARNAEAGSLHETEYIAPYTRNQELDQEPTPVYLMGYIFTHDSCVLSWRDVLDRLQLGGERSYGWGRVCLKKEPVKDRKCFGYDLDCTGDRPRITVPKGKELLAHTDAESVKSVGTIEPLVGRETGSDTGFGKNLTKARICWTPGSTLLEEKTFRIQARGIWTIL